MTSSQPSRRWALTIEYDGSPFVGWQRQKDGISVQTVVEAAASRLAGGSHIACTGGGRTDSGVHAQGQVAVLELPEPKGTPWNADRVRDALNFHMKPYPVAVTRAAVAPAQWHPRFSAIMRAYRYRILNRPARPALDRQRVWHVERPLDEAAMVEAGQALLGQHDFTSFRATACQAASPIRTLDVLEIERVGDEVVIRVQARSFLHHQVRNMAGTLALVGSGRWPVDRVAVALAARDRAAAGPTAPADGLTMVAIAYEPALDPFRKLKAGSGHAPSSARASAPNPPPIA